MILNGEEVKFESALSWSRLQRLRTNTKKYQDRMPSEQKDKTLLLYRPDRS